MTGRLAILGAGGHGRVVADCAECLGRSDIVFFDDNARARPPGPWALAGTGEDLLAEVSGFDAFIVGIGINRIRLVRHQALIAAGGTATTLIHPAATVSRHATVGAGASAREGTIIGRDVVVGAGSVVVRNLPDCVTVVGNPARELMRSTDA